VTDGGRFGRYGLFLSKVWRRSSGKPVFLYNCSISSARVAGRSWARKHTIVFDFKSDGPGLGKGGRRALRGRKESPGIHGAHYSDHVPGDETFDIGQDTRTGSRCWSIATMSRSSSPARSTSYLQPRTAQVRQRNASKMQETVARARD